MRDEEIGRSVRSLRHRRGWRQVDLSSRARRPRSALVDLEAGKLGDLKLDTIRALVDALGARVALTLMALLGALDVKVRVAPLVAREEEWHPRIVIPVIVFAAGTTVRPRLAEHASLFARSTFGVGRRFPGFVVLRRGLHGLLLSPTCQMSRWATVGGLDDDACGWRELSRARLQAIRPLVVPNVRHGDNWRVQAATTPRARPAGRCRRRS